MNNKNSLIVFISFVFCSVFSVVFFYLVKGGYDSNSAIRSYFLLGQLMCVLMIVYADVTYFSNIDKDNMFRFLFHQVIISVTSLMNLVIIQHYMGVILLFKLPVGFLIMINILILTTVLAAILFSLEKIFLKFWVKDKSDTIHY
ncbi:MAG: hypothetical protein CVV21_07630 [Candidatus Goldiibacteriota bacterium HGW-Goldbacteria-1]|jgi:hypothetical protein|nr:MAG: hypothetical protein CVV21_07630 [Candidatus Goldiibacteriota bacterium HGW-Goldbacteria-1]